MKKIYIQPSIEAHKIETANNIVAATSPNDVILQRNANGIEANQVGSRGSNGWDDED